jgi:IMP dehydrogenase/GMP reductase
MKLDFNDLLIVPAIQSDIVSRSEVKPYYYPSEDKSIFHLPIIAAPMDTVINKDVIPFLEKNRISYCIPRGMNEVPQRRVESGIMSFQSFGLDEFIETFIIKTTFIDNTYILIDIANGHMSKMTDAIKSFKKKYQDYYTLMVGNVANPETYKVLSLAGADYIRIGIGNGNGCLTTQQLGIGYPMASLIRECYTIKQSITKSDYEPAKIVADGGMKGYSDIIKALACGADYVMVGSILNMALESAGPTYFKGMKINQYSSLAKWLFKNNFKLTKKFRGMSTKEVQKTWNKGQLKTSEGVSRTRNVEYTIEGWTKNFTDYLKSAMSYTDKNNLYFFTGTADIIQVSDNAFKRYNK